MTWLFIFLAILGFILVTSGIVALSVWLKNEAPEWVTRAIALLVVVAVLTTLAWFIVTAAGWA